MRPRERRETSEQDLFRSRLDQIIDMKHALVKLARAIDWGFSGTDVWSGLHRQAGPAAIADAADGGASATPMPISSSAPTADYASSRPISAVSSATSSGALSGMKICGKRSYGRCS